MRNTHGQEALQEKDICSTRSSEQSKSSPSLKSPSASAKTKIYLSLNPTVNSLSKHYRHVGFVLARWEAKEPKPEHPKPCIESSCVRGPFGALPALCESQSRHPQP